MEEDITKEMQGCMNLKFFLESMVPPIFKEI